MPEATCKTKGSFCLWCREPILIGTTMMVRSGQYRYELYHPCCSEPAFQAQRERQGKNKKGTTSFRALDGTSLGEL